jgi:hypothetical protein
MYVHMPRGKRLFHAKEHFNDVARNICVVFYLHDMEYSIKYSFKLIQTHAHMLMSLIRHNL